MMQATLSPKFGSSGARWALSWLFLVVLSLSTAARGGGGGAGGSNPPDGSTNASSPGDEVTSLPMVEEHAGLTFVGSARAIRFLDIQLEGRGRVSVVRLGGGRLAVTLTGDYRVELDRDALALGDVGVLFRGGRAFAGGLARLQIGDGAPVFLDPERVPLPVSRLAASPRAHGDLVTLDVVSRRHTAHLEAHFGHDTVTLFQRIR